jgi:hypothetical protein
MQMHCGESTNEEVCNKVWLQGFYGVLVIQYLEPGGGGWLGRRGSFISSWVVTGREVVKGMERLG